LAAVAGVIGAVWLLVSDAAAGRPGGGGGGGFLADVGGGDAAELLKFFCWLSAAMRSLRELN
jgi:hypothetical protein